MKLRRLLLPAVGLIVCICAIGAAASLSDRPITVPQEVLQQLGQLPKPPLQMLGETTGQASPDSDPLPLPSTQNRLDLSTLPTESSSRSSQAITPPPTSSASPVPVLGGGFLPDNSTGSTQSPSVRVRRPTYQSTPNFPQTPGQIVPAQSLDLNSLPNPGPAGARRSTPPLSTSQPGP